MANVIAFIGGKYNFITDILLYGSKRIRCTIDIKLYDNLIRDFHLKKLKLGCAFAFSNCITGKTILFLIFSEGKIFRSFSCFCPKPYFSVFHTCPNSSRCSRHHYTVFFRQREILITVFEIIIIIIIRCLCNGPVAWLLTVTADDFTINHRHILCNTTEFTAWQLAINDSCILPIYTNCQNTAFPTDSQGVVGFCQIYSIFRFANVNVSIDIFISSQSRYRHHVKGHDKSQ